MGTRFADELCKMWLTGDVSCDIWPEAGDGIVDMQDFADEPFGYIQLHNQL